MTPQALEDIKATLLENSFGNDAKREITTHQHSQSTAAGMNFINIGLPLIYKMRVQNHKIIREEQYLNEYFSYLL